MDNWFDTPSPEITWLIDGLITKDGYSATCGKPKAGKSTFVRNMIASIITGRPFLGRSVDLPTGTGKVLYVHLDRKDRVGAVVRELKQLGITRDGAERLTLRTAEDLSGHADYDSRLEWLKHETTLATPDLIVIDLFWQFATTEGNASNNDYRATLTACNKLQDALMSCGYKGALLVTMHGRKQTNPNDPFDDMLGSTAQRGSFSTLIMLSVDRSDGAKTYVITTDQTDRDDIYGEIEETILTRNQDGTIELGRQLSEIVTERKKKDAEQDFIRLYKLLEERPGLEEEEILRELGMSKKHVRSLIQSGSGFFTREGKGVRGDAFRYSVKEGRAEQEAAKEAA